VRGNAFVNDVDEAAVAPIEGGDAVAVEGQGNTFSSLCDMLLRADKKEE